MFETLLYSVEYVCTSDYPMSWLLKVKVIVPVGQSVNLKRGNLI